MNTIKIEISGMTCDHCAQSAQDALNALDGVEASVSYNDGQAKVESKGIVDDSQLLKAIASKGYKGTLVYAPYQPPFPGFRHFSKINELFLYKFFIRLAFKPSRIFKIN